MVSEDGTSLFDLAFQDLFCDRVLQVLLDRAVQRAGAELMIVSFLGQEIFRLVRELDVIAEGHDAREKFSKRDIDDLVDVLTLQ